MTQDQVDALRVIAQAMFTPLQEELLQDLCRHIAEAGQCTSQAQYDAYKAQTLGLAPKAVRGYVQQHLQLMDDAVEELLRYAAENTVAFEDDGSLQHIVQGYVKVAGNEARRLVENLGGVNPAGRTVPMQQLYSETMDHAFRQVISGAKPMEEALREATNKLAAAGIRTIEDKAGRSLGIEYAARRMLLDKVGQLNEQITQMNHDELGCTGWEISAHSACAPDHEDIQGRQYSDAEYKKLNSRLKRPIGRLHCKHSADPIFLGEQQPQYTEAELDAMKRENEEGVWYEGKHYTLYEADQYQKDIENSIRLLKRRCLVDKELHDDEQLRQHQIALNRLNTEYTRYSAATGLRTARERLEVAGLGKALRKDGRLEMPQSMSGLKAKDGMLDIDTARRKHLEYLDTLTDVPDRVKMYLDYYNRENPTEYKLNPEQDSTFAYSPVDDAITYNPNAKGFDGLDFDEVALHETAHRADLLGIRSYEDRKFRETIDSAMQAIQQQRTVLQIAADRSKSRAFHDILDALGKGLLKTEYRHSKEYWMASDRNRPLEIFAELVVLETHNSPELKVIKAAWPELWEAYISLF